MHECLLCRRDMKVSNDIFGNGCIKNIYSFLDLKMPKKVKYREETLYKNVMELTNIHSINKNQKIWLTDRYLTYQYLNRIPYGNYNEIKNQINYDIQNIKQIKKDEEPKSAKSMSLKQAYDLYKKVMKFQDGIDKISKGDFTDEDIKKLADTFTAFQEGKLEDEKGFCSVATLQDIEKQDYILTPGRYVGIEEKEDDGEPFEEKMDRLTKELSELFQKSHELEVQIKERLGAIGYEV